MIYVGKKFYLNPSGRPDGGWKNLADELRYIADCIEANEILDCDPTAPLGALLGLHGHAEPQALPVVRPDQVREITALRDRRNEIFGADLFGEPVWDMLLDLFQSRLANKRISVTSLCIASNAPLTTALRHIERMVAAGLIEKADDPADGRRSMVSLSRDAYRKMSLLLG